MQRLTQRDDQGVIAITVVCLMLVMLAMFAFAVDTGIAIAGTRSAQNSADAAALAGALNCARGVAAPAPAPYLQEGQTAPTPPCGSNSVTVDVSKTQDYTFGKIVGLDNYDVKRSATAKWGALNSGEIFPFTFSTCAFPDSITYGEQTPPTAGTLMMLYGQGVARTSCPRDPDTTGQSNNSKGFVADGCQITSVGGYLYDARGNSFEGTGCDGSDINWYLDPAHPERRDVLVPIWGAATDGNWPVYGRATRYTITSLAMFHILGWSGNGNSASDRGGAMQSQCTATGGFTGDPATLGNPQKPCLYGYLIKFVAATGGSTGAPCNGPLITACNVYLDH
jgi:hypothetical protein